MTIETPMPPWQYLVARPHAWRKQLSVVGRNLTAGQCLTTIRANQLSLEAAADEFDLPLVAILEVIQYGEQEAELLKTEAEEERRRLTLKGYGHESPALSG